MTNADPLRLNLITGLTTSPQPATDRVVPRDAAARTLPTVTQPFDTLEEHLGSVYRYALRLTHRPDLAEDLAQETWLRAWRSRQNLREHRATRVWLFRIATNVWTDQLRRGRFCSEPLDTDPPCPRPSVNTTSDDRENVRLALAAMDQLPERQRQVLYLITCENMTRDEVAAILGISETAINSNLSLARKEMRQRLKEVYEQVCSRPTTERP